MKVLNLLTAGAFGGIEIYCRNIGLNATYANGFCFLFGEGSVYDAMVSDGLVVYSIGGGKKLSIKRLITLKKIVKDYDVIVAHHGDPFLQVYYILLRYLYPQKKFIRILHSCFANYSFQGYGLIKRCICNLEFFIVAKISDLIISVSQAVEKSYGKFLNGYPQKLKIIYNGVGEDFIKDGGRATFSKTVPVKLLYVGRLSAEKGVINLIDAVSQVSFDYELKIVGDGIEKKNLMERVDVLNLQNKIFFEGSQSDIKKYLADCSIFILPTLWESFGLSLVEAMAYGRVCIANPVGGVPEIIEDGINGFLSENSSAESLKNKLEEAVSMLEYSEDIRKNARKTAERFSISRACNKFKQTYTELLMSK